MTKQVNRRGLSSSGLVLSLVGAVVVVGGGAYLLSDVWRTKIKAEYKNMTEWTPERQAEDPVNFLNFCEEKVVEAKKKLTVEKSTIIRLRVAESDKKETAEKAIADGLKALKILKEARDNGDSSNTWPITLKNKTLTREQLLDSANVAFHVVERNKKNLATAGSNLSKLDQQEKKISELIVKAEDKLSEIKRKRSKISVDKAASDIKDELAGLGAGVESVLVSSDEDYSSTISIEELVGDDGTVDKAAEDSIFGIVE